MTSQRTRTVVFLFLICLSIASYAYLNSVDHPVAPQQSETQIDELDQEKEGQNAVHLPDVRALRTVIEAGKRILPAS
jgi:hypothetical protein